MKKTQVARDVVQKLYAAENSLDTTIAEMATLLATLVEARQQLGLAAPTGAESIARISEALTALNAARAATVVGHDELKQVYDTLGLRGVAVIVKPGFPPIEAVATRVAA